MNPTDKAWVRSQIARNLDPLSNRIEAVRKELLDTIDRLEEDVDRRLDALEADDPIAPAPPSLPALVTCPEVSPGVPLLEFWDGTQSNVPVMVDVESTPNAVNFNCEVAKENGCTVWQYVPTFNGEPYYSPHADGYVVRCDWSNGPEHAIAALDHAMETGKPVAALIDGRRHDKGVTTAPTFREVDPEGRPAWPFGRLADTDLHTHVRAILTALPGTPIVFWSCPTDWGNYHKRNGPDDQLVRSVIDYELTTQLGGVAVTANDWLWRTFSMQAKVIQAAIDGKPCPYSWSIAPKPAPAEPPVVPPTGTLPISFQTPFVRTATGEIAAAESVLEYAHGTEQDGVHIHNVTARDMTRYLFYSRNSSDVYIHDIDWAYSASPVEHVVRMAAGRRVLIERLKARGCPKTSIWLQGVSTFHIRDINVDGRLWFGWDEISAYASDGVLDNITLDTRRDAGNHSIAFHGWPNGGCSFINLLTVNVRTGRGDQGWLALSPNNKGVTWRPDLVNLNGSPLPNPWFGVADCATQAERDKRMANGSGPVNANGNLIG